MSSYSDWHPGNLVASAADRYTELVNAKRQTPHRPTHTNQPARDAAEQLTCPNSPATHGLLARHRFGINDTTCAYCDDSPEWILAALNHPKEALT